MSLPCGTRNFSYNTDTAIIRTKTQWVLFVVFLALLFCMPLFTSKYWLGVTNLIGITVISIIGLNILVGYCGQLSIGHAGFMAVGAYTTAVLTKNFEVPFLVAFLCSGLTAGIIGLLFGIPSMRVKGFYLAITTIAAQFIIIWIINHWTEVTQGFTGVSVPPAAIGNFVFDSEVKQFYLILPLTALCIFFATNLGRSRIGRAFIAIRDNDLAAEVMGINVFNYKLLAFFLGCFFAGIAGSLFAQSNFINAENFTFTDSILYIGMIIIGGLGTAVGPIFGAVFIRLLQQFVIMLSPMIEGIFTWLPSGFATGIGPMVFGLVIVLFLVIEPRGLAHRWNLFKASYRLWPFSY